MVLSLYLFDQNVIHTVKWILGNLGMLWKSNKLLCASKVHICILIQVGTTDSFQMHICSYRTLLWKHRHCEVFLNTQYSLSLKAFETSLLMNKHWLWRLKMCFLQKVIYTQISTRCSYENNPISKQSRGKGFNIYDPPLKKY